MIRKALFMLSLLAVSCVAQLTASPRLTIHTFGEIDSLQKIEKRNVLVFIHTDWCRYCQSMEHTTLKDRKIITLLNEKFWFADLNAEERQDIVFNGHAFKYKPTGSNTGVHELAEQLGTINGQVSYPTVCMLNPDYKITFQYNQYLSAKDLLKVLQETLNSF